MIELFSIEWFALVLGAALLAMVLRIEDYPSENLKDRDLPALAKSFLFSSVAAFVGGWLLTEQGMNIGELMNFLILAGVSLSGMAGVRALMETAKKVIPERSE